MHRSHPTFEGADCVTGAEFDPVTVGMAWSDVEKAFGDQVFYDAGSGTTARTKSTRDPAAAALALLRTWAVR